MQRKKYELFGKDRDWVTVIVCALHEGEKMDWKLEWWLRRPGGVAAGKDSFCCVLLRSIVFEILHKLMTSQEHLHNATRRREIVTELPFIYQPIHPSSRNALSTPFNPADLEAWG